MSIERDLLRKFESTMKEAYGGAQVEPKSVEEVISNFYSSYEEKWDDFQQAAPLTYHALYITSFLEAMYADEDSPIMSSKRIKKLEPVAKKIWKDLGQVIRDTDVPVELVYEDAFYDVNELNNSKDVLKSFSQKLVDLDVLNQLEEKEFEHVRADLLEDATEAGVKFGSSLCSKYLAELKQAIIKAQDEIKKYILASFESAEVSEESVAYAVVKAKDVGNEIEILNVDKGYKNFDDAQAAVNDLESDTEFQDDPTLMLFVAYEKDGKLFNATTDQEIIQ